MIESLPDYESALRDANDQTILSTLLAAMQLGSADYFVTGDKGLLELAGRFSIITPANFWVAHGGL